MRIPRAAAWRYLEWDGGWLTTEGIAMEVDLSPDTVDRSMWRWREGGHVETRRIDLAGSGGLTRRGTKNGTVEARREWKAT